MTNIKIPGKWLLTYLGSPPFQCDMPILEAIYLNNAQNHRCMQLEQFFNFLFNKSELITENINSLSPYKLLLKFDNLSWRQADIQINECMVCTVEIHENIHENSYLAIGCRLVVRIRPGSYIAYFQTFFNWFPLEMRISWNRRSYVVLGLSETDVISLIPQEKNFNSNRELALEMMNEEAQLERDFYPNPDVEQFKAKFFDGDPHLSMLYGNEKPNLIRLLKYLEK